MKLFSNKANTILPLIEKKHIIATLLYGPNYGMKAVISKKIITFLNQSGYHEVTNVLQEDVDKDQSILYNHLFHSDLFGAKKIVILNGATSKTDTVTNYILDNRDQIQYPFIVIAGELDAKSALKTTFEKRDDCASIGCYDPDKKDNIQDIKAFFLERGVAVESRLVDQLADFFMGDRLMMESELEKLHLYLGNRTELNAKDVEAIILPNEGDLPMMMVESIVDGNAVKAMHILSQIRNLDFNAVGMCRIVLAKIMQLRRMRFNIENGSNVDAEIQKERIFFKNIPVFQKQLNKFKISYFDKIIYHLLHLEIQIKSNADALYVENEIKHFVINTIR